MDYYSVIKKKNESLPFMATWMDHEGVRLSKISQTEKDKYRMIDLICGTSNKQTNKEQQKTKLTDNRE